MAAAPSSPSPSSPGAWLRARRAALRPWHVAVLTILILLFLAISVLLARFLATENVERDDVLAVLQAEAAGNSELVLQRLDHCRYELSCAATVRADAQRLRRSGPVKILSLTSSTAYSLTGDTGNTRVAWTVIGRLPIVQCIRVKRFGSFLSGVHVTLLSLSAPIANEADC